MEDYDARRQELVDIEKKMHFSWDLEETLTDEDRIVGDILHRLSEEVKQYNYNAVIHDYFENFVRLFLPLPPLIIVKDERFSFI